MYQMMVQELADDGIAETVYIHGITGNEVSNPFKDNSGAVRIDTARSCFSFPAYDGTATARTPVRHRKYPFTAIPVGRNGPDDFRNDFPRLLNDDGITDADIFFTYIVFIMQSCPFDYRPGKSDWL